MQEEQLLSRQDFYPIQNCIKIQDDNHTAYPKFEMATYEGNSKYKIELQLSYYSYDYRLSYVYIS